MNSLRYILFSLLLIGCCSCIPSFAQSGKQAPIRKRAGKDTTPRQKRDIRESVAKWDKNRDGMLQFDEIPKEHRKQVYGAARKRGMNLKQPLGIASLFEKPSTDAKEKKRSAKNGTKAKDAGQEKAEETDVVQKSPKGFGQAARKKAAAKAKSATDGGGRDKAIKSKALRLAANSMMFQHDKNQNGRLDKNEWSRLKRNPAAADKNQDGALSKDELAGHLAGYGSREEKPRPKYRSVRRTRVSGGEKKSYRFLTPHERLPKGLPEWFIERDENLDGQISLKEYAPSLTRATYEKFAQLDLNKDGLLVAKEYLKATK